MRALKTRRVTVDIHPTRAVRVLKTGPEKREHQYPYLLAEVAVIHTHGCACTRHGLKFGPCDCGGAQLYQEWLAYR